MDTPKLKKGIVYIVLSFILWLIVEYITVWNGERFAEWMSYMPWILIQYLFIILIFWFFLFIKNWNHKRAFIVMIIVMYFFEFLWQNPLLLNLIWFIPISILLIQIWGFLTFIPFWIINKSIKQNIKLTIFYCLWPILGFIMALIMG
jgi:hypothetical protein